MAKITLESLRCIEQEDSGPDGDEIRIELLTTDHEKVTLWEGQMKKGDKRDIGKSQELRTVARITLFDLDYPDPDDNLGNWNAPFLSTDGEMKIHSFTGKEAHYELVYAVD